ncbi:hypothetical protein Sango_2412400 [Sesamum angolense]|uniref:Uncharacterized protein n=1 Tax=Sesamum angolense TaxID=2727404 RepID=A0AAE1W757_9LAMI|nr:hypothetical protein Sango_2412400 [Sesamum angolense]
MVCSRNVSPTERVNLAAILGVKVEERHAKYLGLPTVIGRSKSEVFDSVKDRIERIGLCHLILCFMLFSNRNIFHTPSFTWRSLLRYPELLVAGLRWKVGDGTPVPIAGEPWLPRAHTFRPIFRPRTLHGDTKVAQLITEKK